MKEDKTKVSEQSVVAEEAAPADHSIVAEFEVSKDAIERAIHRWVGQAIHDSPVSRETETYNYVMGKLPQLAQLIKEEMGR